MFFVILRSSPSVINRNMGCIEIGTDYTEKEADGRLIETWDVLKFLRFCDKGMWVLD